jgi:molybdopterin/thiamine biosynthesis adenylyltransferase
LYLIDSVLFANYLFQKKTLSKDLWYDVPIRIAVRTIIRTIGMKFTVTRFDAISAHRYIGKLGLEMEKELFDRESKLGWWDRDLLKKSLVIVAGVGALGNEILKNLALVGIGRLVVVDFDVVESSNLSRSVLFRRSDVTEHREKAFLAAERARELSPLTSLQIDVVCGDINWDLGGGLLRRANLVVGCVDSIGARLGINRQCWQYGIPWFDSGMSRLSGSVSFYTMERKHACFECTLSEKSFKLAEKRFSCSNQTLRAGYRPDVIPLTQTTAAVIGGIASQEAVKFLHKLPIPAGCKIEYLGEDMRLGLDDGYGNLIVKRLSTRNDCICHAEPQIGVQEIKDLPGASANLKGREFLFLIKSYLGIATPVVELGMDYVFQAECREHGIKIPINRPKSKVLDVEVACPECIRICPRCGEEVKGIPDCLHCGLDGLNEMDLLETHQLSEASDSTILDKPLRDIGIPWLQVLKVYSSVSDNPYYIELSDDIQEFKSLI